MIHAKERRLMEHATGWKSREPLCRNHFVTGTYANDWPVIQGLCERGLMKETRGPDESGHSVFAVTELGIAELRGDQEDADPRKKTSSPQDPSDGVMFATASHEAPRRSVKSAGSTAPKGGGVSEGLDAPDEANALRPVESGGRPAPNESELTATRAEVELRSAQVSMVSSELCGDRKIDPNDTSDHRWTPALKAASELRTEVNRLKSLLARLSTIGKERAEVERLTKELADMMMQHDGEKEAHERTSGELSEACDRFGDQREVAQAAIKRVDEYRADLKEERARREAAELIVSRLAGRLAALPPSIIDSLSRNFDSDLAAALRDFVADASNKKEANPVEAGERCEESLHPTGRCECGGAGDCKWCRSICPRCGGGGETLDACGSCRSRCIDCLGTGRRPPEPPQCNCEPGIYGNDCPAHGRCEAYRPPQEPTPAPASKADETQEAMSAAEKLPLPTLYIVVDSRDSLEYDRERGHAIAQYGSALGSFRAAEIGGRVVEYIPAENVQSTARAALEILQQALDLEQTHREWSWVKTGQMYRGAVQRARLKLAKLAGGG